MTARRIGYIRTSPVDKADDLEQLAWPELDAKFMDELVGPKSPRRPQRRDAMASLKPGDTLVVQSMERIARDKEELDRLLMTLATRGVSVEFVTEAITFAPDDPLRLRRELALLAAGQRFVRASDAERQREGISKATKVARRYSGRNLKLSRSDAEAVIRRARDGQNIAQIARDFGISRQTVYRYAKAGPVLVVASALAAKAQGQRARALRTERDSAAKRKAAFANSARPPVGRPDE
jgi:DNA invertase Pin-like site-specific DNA recombinase